ncbi:MAG: PilZ domain-containing protein [Candidatus Omnitrophica bacterium]|nr:PilZ domain-containing protein [Candidatus Omnitrophota bacterium]MDD5591712.1 PilZ domain-containing protein [Candidatus Omnitrophota bacterium]
MIKRKKTTERRRYPRIKQALPIKIVANGYDFTTSTQNISCVGAYCCLDKYIPPFTKIAAKVILPITNAKRIENVEVECTGVIVRTEDKENGGFNIAIFFNKITPGQRKKISQYVNQFLPKESCGHKRL